MMSYSAKELFQILNQQDECDWIEAKGGSESSHSVMETVCALSAPVLTESEPVHEAIVNQLPEESEPAREALVNQLPVQLKEKLNKFTGRTTDKEALKIFICELCAFKEYSTKQLSLLFTKQEKYLLHNFIKPLREAGRLEYIIPEMPNHPQQAYKTKL